jgi:hypothetical protein
LAANQTHIVNLGTGGPGDCAKPALPEIRRGNRRDAIWHTRVTINIRYIYIGNIHATVEESWIAEASVESVSPPGVHGFKRRQRHPSDISKPEANADAGSESEETDEGRRPIMMSESAGIPAPAVARR